MSGSRPASARRTTQSPCCSGRCAPSRSTSPPPPAAGGSSPARRPIHSTDAAPDRASSPKSACCRESSGSSGTPGVPRPTENSGRGSRRGRRGPSARGEFGGRGRWCRGWCVGAPKMVGAAERNRSEQFLRGRAATSGHARRWKRLQAFGGGLDGGREPARPVSRHGLRARRHTIPPRPAPRTAGSSRSSPRHARRHGLWHAPHPPRARRRRLLEVARAGRRAPRTAARTHAHHQHALLPPSSATTACQPSVNCGPRECRQRAALDKSRPLAAPGRARPTAPL